MSYYKWSLYNYNEFHLQLWSTSKLFTHRAGKSKSSLIPRLLVGGERKYLVVRGSWTAQNNEQPKDFIVGQKIADDGSGKYTL